ncbi:hypothetical protein [Agrobacterium radiobacter]|uniref:hypothetical protein n=1 Tax=Agrobacterium radiobacter TaxID=362 RepID=UPI003F84F66C
MNWSVESYQLVYFHQPLIIQDAFQIWLSLFQATPDSYQRHPDPNARATQAGGNFAGYTWQIAAQPGRIDIFIVGNTSDGADPLPTFPNIKNDIQARDLLIAKARQLPIEAIGVVRLAFVTQLSHNVTKLQDANNLIAELLPLNAIPTSASDMSFSLNLRKSITTPPVVLNRICRWQAVEKQLVQLQMGVPQTMQSTISQPAVMLNVDINTVQQQSGIKTADIDPIIQSLVQESAAIRSGGYDEFIS